MEQARLQSGRVQSGDADVADGDKIDGAVRGRSPPVQRAYLAQTSTSSARIPTTERPSM